MRITSVLCKQHLGRMFREKWKQVSKVQIQDLGVPPLLKEKGVEIVDMKEVAKPEWPEIQYTPPPEDEFEKEKKHPLYKENRKHFFNTDTIFPAGVNQAQVLTKTVKIDHLPFAISDLVGKVSVPNQDALTTRAIQFAHHWDTAQFPLARLPNVRDVKLPEGTRRPWGPPWPRVVGNMGSGLLKICGSLHGRYEKLSDSVLVHDADVNLLMERGGEQIGLYSKSLATLLSEKPFPVLASKEEVETTKESVLPELFPINPILDLKKVHIYRNKDKYMHSLTETYHPHLVVIANNVPRRIMRDEHLTASAIVNAFTFAAGHARRLFGNEVQQLPNPVSLQLVLFDGNGRFQFCVYQLNTLDVNSEDGIKNIVWMDPLELLFDEKASKDTLPDLEDYNPQIMQKLLAMYSSPEILNVK